MSNHPTSKSSSTSISAEVFEEPDEEQLASTESALIAGLPWLTRDRVGRLFKFGLVGVSGVFVNLVVFEFFFRIVHLQFAVANALGIAVSIFTNFVLNDVWTWGDRRKGAFRDWIHRLVKYYVSASLAAGVQLAVAWISKELVFEPLPTELPAEWVPEAWRAAEATGLDIGPTLAVLTGIGCGMIINFAASHWWAFRDAEDDS